MRHRKKSLKLNRHAAHRRMLLANLVRGLFINEAITTTVAKAKAAQPLAEKMITLGKKNNLPAQRQAVSILHDKKVVKQLFSEIAPKFSDRTGGYTRIVRTVHRHGDGAPLAILELVGRLVEPKQAPADEKGKKKDQTQVAPAEKAKSK